MLGLAMPWVVIIVIFLACTICHVIRGDQLLKEKYRKKHQEVKSMQDGTKRLCALMTEYDFPIEYIQDVLYRLGWHFLSGGRPTDDYVWTQVRYFENLIKYGKASKKEVIK